MNYLTVVTVQRLGIHSINLTLQFFLYLAFSAAHLQQQRALVERVSRLVFSLERCADQSPRDIQSHSEHIGKKHEEKPLFLSAVNKAFMFSLLVLGFRFIEEGIKRLLLSMGTHRTPVTSDSCHGNTWK